MKDINVVECYVRRLHSNTHYLLMQETQARIINFVILANAICQLQKIRICILLGFTFTLTIKSNGKVIPTSIEYICNYFYLYFTLLWCVPSSDDQEVMVTCFWILLNSSLGGVIAHLFFLFLKICTNSYFKEWKAISHFEMEGSDVRYNIAKRELDAWLTKAKHELRCSVQRSKAWGRCLL